MSEQTNYQNSIVSIITPFLDAEDFLQEAIESVIAQTYEHWELLLVDDGSTDNSTAIAQRYAARYPQKIRYLEHENHQNRGKSTSRNLGIQQARGNYITFLDADDVFLPQKLERQVAILETHPEAVMVYGRTQYWFSWAGDPKALKQDYLGKLGVTVNVLYEPPELLTRFLSDGGMVPCICSLLARRKTVLDTGAFEETVQHMYEDQVLLAKLCLAGPVFVEDGWGERYRQHQNSSSFQAVQNGEYHPWRTNSSRLAFLTWLEDYIKKLGVQDAVLDKAMQRNLWAYEHPKLYDNLIGPLKYGLAHIQGYASNRIKRITLNR